MEEVKRRRKRSIEKEKKKLVSDGRMNNTG